jgi:hypothetical protein
MPVGAKFSASLKIGPDTHPPTLLYNGNRVSFLGVKQLESGVDQPPTLSTEVKERVEIFL